VPGQSAQLLSTAAAEAGRNALAATLLRQNGRLRLPVSGSSMLPAIRPRDILLVRACAADAPRVGEIVVYTRDGRIFAHRLVARRGATMIAQGDTLSAADAPVQAGELLGRVVKVVRRGRAFRPRVDRGGATRLAAAIFARCARAARLFTRLDGLAR